MPGICHCCWGLGPLGAVTVAPIPVTKEEGEHLAERAGTVPIPTNAIRCVQPVREGDVSSAEGLDFHDLLWPQLSPGCLAAQQLLDVVALLSKATHGARGEAW